MSQVNIDRETLVQAALDYAVRGWPVFPCAPATKQPLLGNDIGADGKKIPRTGGLKKASCDPDQIRAWWKKWPRALIGVATGHGRLFVLDFDPRTDEATGEVWTLERLKGELETGWALSDGTWVDGVGQLPPSLISITQSGGVHVWLTWPDDDGAPIGNRGNLPLHVDVRGLGGYVIAPPSVMASGREYHWLRRDGVALGPERVAISEAPPALVAILRTPKGEGIRSNDSLGGEGSRQPSRQGSTAARTERQVIRSDDPVEVARRKWALAAFDNAIGQGEALPDGQRNAGISAIAITLGSIIGAGYLSETMVRAELDRIARLWPNVEKTLASIESALEKGKGSPRDMSEIGTQAGSSRGPVRREEGARQPFAPMGSASDAPPRTPAQREALAATHPDGRVSLQDLPAAEGARMLALAEAWLQQRWKRLNVDDGEAVGRFAYGLGRRVAAGLFGEGWIGPRPWPVAALASDAGAKGYADGMRRALDLGPMLTMLRAAMRPMTDMGNAERFHDRSGPDFRFTTAKGWLGWDKARWAVLDQDKDNDPAELRAAVFGTVRAIQDEGWAVRTTGRPDDGVTHGLDDEVYEDKKPRRRSYALMDWGRKSESAGKIGCIANLAKRWQTVPIEQFDCEHLAINVLNGTLRFSVEMDDAGRKRASVRLEPHRRDDLNTKLCPVAYVADAPCPVYDDFISWAHPDEGMRRYLRQVVGYSLTGHTGEQLLWFHYGRGANGKSTAFDIWAEVAGDYAGTIGIETFLDQGIKKRGEQASPDLARLGGVRFLRSSEPERGARLNEALVKAATGGEPMAVRALHRGFFDLRPLFKLHIAGNYRPDIPGTDEGIWRRMKLVPWDQHRAAHERDRTLPDKLRKEAEGVLRWMIDGVIDWLENGLVEPGAVSAATAQYREDSDPLARFLKMCVEDDAKGRVQSSELHAVFAAWAKAAGEKEWTQVGFSKAMRDKGFEKKASDGIWWLGIRLVKQSDDFVDKDGRVKRIGEAGDAGDGARANADPPPYRPPEDDDYVPGFDDEPSW